MRSNHAETYPRRVYRRSCSLYNRAQLDNDDSLCVNNNLSKIYANNSTPPLCRYEFRCIRESSQSLQHDGNVYRWEDGHRFALRRQMGQAVRLSFADAFRHRRVSGLAGDAAYRRQSGSHLAPRNFVWAWRCQRGRFLAGARPRKDRTLRTPRRSEVEKGTLTIEADMVPPKGARLGSVAEEFRFDRVGPAYIIDARVSIHANAGLDLKLGDTEEAAFAIRVSEEFRQNRGCCSDQFGRA